MNPQRRHVATALIAAPALVLPHWVRAQSRGLTPAQTEGPFYPDELPADHDGDLLTHGNLRYAQGQATVLSGTVSDAQGRAVRNAVVDIWQCDQQGRYRHPRDSRDGNRIDAAFQGFGRVVTDEQGRYRFRTIRPAAYTGRTPHIHVKVLLGERELLTTQLYVQGEAGNARDFLYRSLSEAERAALTVPFVAAADGLRADFPIVVAA